MVHTYECLGRHFLLDVESGSVFIVDELTAKLIEKRSPSACAKGDFSKYSETEINEANAEIDELIRQGVLFSTQPEHPEPIYKGIVKALCLNIAHGCNLRCRYCFAEDGQYHGKLDYMSVETAKKAIDFLIARSGSRRRLEVDFFGGEPLLNMEAVKETIDYARKVEKTAGKEFRFTITTNAVALTDDLIEYFNREMYNVVLSIDGRKEVHDAVRPDAGGKGSFDKCLANALKLVKARGGKSYYVRGTFTANNLDFAKDILALNDYGFGQVSLEPVVLPDSSPLALKNEHVDGLKQQYELLAKEYVKRRADGKEFGFFHFNIDIYNGPCASKRLVGCNAGDEYLCVAPNGNIYPCHRFDGMDEYVIGNVNDGSWCDDLPQKFATTNLTKKEDCNECWAKYYCSGGCAANSIQLCGGITKPYKLGCELMKKRVECALAIAAIEGENK
ncbi:MAG: thioether cross-link-forming SCIFF peptide maturase [Clostridia bacterium]|nr:thioether cross-link-forming SCIFF peptide maturase [Clostridia bacterium]